MYNNLIYFLVAIFLYSLDSVPEMPLFPLYASVALFLVLAVSYRGLCTFSFKKIDGARSTLYFQTEKRLSICAILFYGVALFLCDIKYHLHIFSLGGHIPAFPAVIGLGIFLFFLCLMWRAGANHYNRAFASRLSKKTFVVNQIRNNLPIVLPWLFFSFASDLIGLLPFPALQEILETGWGDLFFFLAVFGFVLLVFPPLVQRLWNCRPLPAGELRSHLEEFCGRQKFSAKYFIWPLMEGRAITAGVMGFIPGMRYILLTPAIIETMSREELDAIMAHEIAHVKKAHIFLYLCIILGFSLLAGFLAEPLLYYILSMNVMIQLMVQQITSSEVVVSLVGGVPLLLLVVVYFRYLFGYFMRNFERQADLYTIGVMGTAQPLVSAFEKIATFTGASKSETNWHHFGLGERIDCLVDAENDPSLVGRHDRKVRYSLVAFFLAMALVSGGGSQLSLEKIEHSYKEKYTEAALYYSAEQEPSNPLWQRLIGDMMLSRKMEVEAAAAYRKALAIDPQEPGALNNLAWLLLTTENDGLRNPARALKHALVAASMAPEGFVLDTLATAYWANDMVKLALDVQSVAIKKDPEKEDYYRLRMELFQRQSYAESFGRL